MIVFLFVYHTCPRIRTICRKADCSPRVASYHRLVFDFIVQPLFIHWRVAWMENTEVDKRYHLLKQKKKENLICRTEGQIQAQLWTRRSGWRNRPVQDRRTGRYQEAPGTDSPLRRTCKEKDKTWPPTWMLIGVSLMSVRKSTVKISGAVPVGGRLDDDINTWGPFFLWPFLKYSELKWVKQIEGHERAVHLLARPRSGWL